MNLKTLLCGFAAAAMLTACASDEPNNGGGNNNGNGDLVDAGYITVGINLPTTQGSRANNDKFDHGLNQEYAVKNAMLLVFTGASEATATFHSGYELTMVPGGVDGAPGENITTSYLQTVHLHNVADDDHLWGLVLVNSDGVAEGTLKDGVQSATGSMKESEVYKGLFDSVKINGNAISTATTFAKICEYISTNSFINSDYFFMTNAVISDNKPGEAVAPEAGAIYTLQEIGTASAVTYPTEAEAKANPAASFYVERAVAKATLTWSNVLKAGSDLALSENVTGIESIEWFLDNTEPTSYIVRNVSDNSYIGYANNSKYRFVGAKAIGTTAIQPERPLYRHYWAIDPGYDADANLTTAVSKDMVNSAIAASLFKATGTDKPQYCHENTFDVAHMIYKNSTRAVLKVKFQMPEGGDGSLWVVNNVSNSDASYKNIYKSAADACSNVVKAIVESHDVRDAVKAALNPGESMTVTADDLEITYGLDPKTNVYSVSQVAFKENTKFQATPAPFTAESSLVKNVNATFQVVKYEGGVAYYDIRFKHFGDEYCPWSPASQTTTTTAIAYDNNNAQKFLGRWGMVRNNWYEINVSSISNLGKPVIGNLYVSDDTTPDDNNEVEKYMAFKINILSWAKRVQNEDL